MDHELKAIFEKYPDLLDLEIAFWKKAQNPMCDPVRELEEFQTLKAEQDRKKE